MIDDPVLMDELRCQGAQALRSWLERYRGAAEAAGVDVVPIERIAEAMQVKRNAA
jgi:hypothetical protein